MRREYSLHQVGLTQISMPGNRVRVFAHLLIVEFTNSPAPEIVVVINQPYFRLQSSRFDSRPQMFAYILDLDLLWQQAGGHAAVLVCINFILRSHSIDTNPFGFIRLQEFHDVACTRAEILAAKS